MKPNFICFKFSKIFLFTSLILIIFTFLLIIDFRNLYQKRNTNISLINSTLPYNTINVVKEQKPNENKLIIKKQTRTIPKKLKGFEIIGKIEIPKLKVEKYIINKTSTKSLKVSVTKVCGPDINQIGNFCIAGHNYNKIFGKIKTLEKNDKILLTDIYGNTIIYQVYDVYKTSPKDVSCLNQDTQSEKELTLITCTAGATKRVIVKAIEVYD